jgi:hypothetical protein
MDTMYLLTHSVICYQYDSWLKPRVQTIDEWRLRVGHWTETEEALYDQETENHVHKYGEPDYWESALDNNRALEPEKTLVEIDYDSVLARHVLGKRLYEGWYRSRGERICAITFFHNDNDTANMLFDGNTPQRRLELKEHYLACCLNAPFVKTVEIPYDFILTKEYLRDLFMEYAVDASDREYNPIRQGNA